MATVKKSEKYNDNFSDVGNFSSYHMDSDNCLLNIKDKEDY